MEPVRYDFDTSRIHRNQIIHLILLLLMSVPFSVLTFLFRHSPHGESYAFLFWVFIILLPFVIALVRYLMLYKRTIRSYEITTDGIIKINDDAYDLKERTLFFVPGTGALRLFWFFPRRLCVKDENEKMVGYYYCGVAADSKTSSDIGKFIALCYVLCEAAKHDMTRKEVQTEIYNKFDVVTVEFPLRAIRREFYKVGSLPIGLGVLGYALSFFAFNDPSITQSEIKLLRYLSLVCIFIGIVFALLFILKYRFTPKRIEVRKDCLTIDGRVLDKNKISSIRMSQKNTLLFRDEDDSWMFINYENKWLRYFLGQAKNSDCFEARRKLTSAIKILLSDEEEDSDPDEQEESEE